jgi:hypothetical protein
MAAAHDELRRYARRVQRRLTDGGIVAAPIAQSVSHRRHFRDRSFGSRRLEVEDTTNNVSHGWRVWSQRDSIRFIRGRRPPSEDRAVAGAASLQLNESRHELWLDADGVLLYGHAAEWLRFPCNPHDFASPGVEDLFWWKTDRAWTMSELPFASWWNEIERFAPVATGWWTCERAIGPASDEQLEFADWQWRGQGPPQERVWGQLERRYPKPCIGCSAALGRLLDGHGVQRR